jgi:hypothetical protein
MSYDEITLSPQKYDLEWEDKNGNLRLSHIVELTASKAERKFRASRQDIAVVLCVEPTE